MSSWGSARALIGVMAMVAVLAACSPGAGAVQTAPTIPRVGLIHVGTDHVPPSLDTLVAGLAELGWMDGSGGELVATLTKDGTLRTARIELIWQNVEPAEVEAAARALVRERVDVVVAFEDRSIAAAQAATTEPDYRVPVVFLHPSDPVRDGLVESLSHPGGNLTGVFGARDPIKKQLQIYKQIIPGLRRLLTLVDPADPATAPLLDQANEAADHLGLELDIREASAECDLERAFESLAPGEVDGAFILSPSLRLFCSTRAIELATAAKLAVQAHRREWVEHGALFSLGVDVRPVGEAGARYVDSILKGTAPADLPVQDVPRVEFAISLATAARLGIEVPPDVIVDADHVYP